QALARELGIGDRLVDQMAKGAMVWTGKRLEPLAEGHAAELLGIQVPTDVGAVPAVVAAQHAAPLQGGFRSFAGGMGEITEALAGYALLRAFLERADGDPAALAHRELASVLGLSGPPLLSRVFHWRRGLPRYKPGHAERVAHVRERLARLAPLDIAGAGFDGVGVSACVKSGREAAQRVLGRLGVDPGAPPRSQPSPGR